LFIPLFDFDNHYYYFFIIYILFDDFLSLKLKVLGQG